MSSTRPCQVRSFAAATFLVAKGHTFQAAVKSKDGNSGVIFCFPPEAQRDFEEYLRVKEQINDAVAVANQQ